MGDDSNDDMAEVRSASDLEQRVISLEMVVVNLQKSLLLQMQSINNIVALLNCYDSDITLH